MKSFLILLFVLSCLALTQAQLPQVEPTGPAPIYNDTCLSLDPDLTQVCDNYSDQESCNQKKFCFWRSGQPQNNLANFHNDQFWPPRIEELVAGSVYQAIGFAISNCFFVKTPSNTWIMVDVTGGVIGARRAAQAFYAYANITEADFMANLKAIFYTHGHSDHTLGAKYFVDGQPNVQIWAHQDLVPNTIARISPVQPNIFRRTFMMTGWFLPKDNADWHISSGLGPFLSFYGVVDPFQAPTNTFAGTLNLNIDGLTLELHHTPGETEEELFIYIDQYQTGFVGDNWYQMFPQLYTIRGTTPRPATDWDASLVFIRDNFPNMNVLAPSHSKAVFGHANIVQALDDWHLAIQDLSATTIAKINQNKNIYDIVSEYQLPPTIASSPYLGEFYGQIPDHVHAIHTQFYGWYTGDITELQNESTTEKSEFILTLCGTQCLKMAQDFLEIKNYNAALKLSDAVRKVLRDDCTNSDFVEATDIFIQAAKMVAYQQPAANNRNYYLTVAFFATNNPCQLNIG